MSNRKGFKYSVSIGLAVVEPGSWQADGDGGFRARRTPVTLAKGYDGARVFGGGGLGVAINAGGGYSEDRDWFELQFGRRDLMRWTQGKEFRMDLMLYQLAGGKRLNFGTATAQGQTKHVARAVTNGLDGSLYYLRASPRSLYWLMGYHDAIVEVVRQARSNRGKSHELGELP